MPKAGFRTITLKESIYDYFQKNYRKNKDGLAKLGISNMTAYISFLLVNIMEDEQLFKTVVLKRHHNIEEVLKDLKI